MGQHPATSATGWQQVASQALLDGNGFLQAEHQPDAAWTHRAC
ncbi:MAG: hypothetical protein WKF73_03195 [Nocardioidaceae bacterium]